MEQSAKIDYKKCAWCDKEVIELFTFIWEEIGDKDYICEDCLRSVEDEFYKLEEVLSTW